MGQSAKDARDKSFLTNFGIQKCIILSTATKSNDKPMKYITHGDGKEISLLNDFFNVFIKEYQYQINEEFPDEKEIVVNLSNGFGKITDFDFYNIKICYFQDANIYATYILNNSMLRNCKNYPAEKTFSFENSKLKYLNSFWWLDGRQGKVKYKSESLETFINYSLGINSENFIILSNENLTGKWKILKILLKDKIHSQIYVELE